MKRFSFRWSVKQWILFSSFLASLIIALFLHLFSGFLKDQLPHEQVAKQWDDEGNTAHVSVYFTESEKYNLKSDLDEVSFRMESWYHQILQELQNASITVDTKEHPSARLAVYGYMASGEITMSTEYGTTSTRAFGIGGDFFQFHPLNMVQGGYFSESSLMQDQVVIDTETAWKLYGSNDVVGMFVKINGIPHIIVGVYERESGYFNDAAGNDKSCVYVSHSTLAEHGQYHGLETVEYLIPNPVSGFAMGLVEKQFSSMDIEMMEHQNRFGILALLSIVKEFGTRSMGLSGITFPYWENMARGYEDILAGLLLVELILLAYALIVFICVGWTLWLHRKWRARGIYRKVADLVYEAGARRQLQKNSAKKKKANAGSEDELDFEDL